MIALALLVAIDPHAFLAEARRGGADGSVEYRDPGLWQRAVQGAWFAAVFAVVDHPERVARLAPLARLGGLSARVGEHRGRPILVVADEPGKRRGSGAWVFRLGPVGAEVFVQAPHTWSDLGTLDIAHALFDAADARLLGVNTVHRRGRAGEEPGVRGHADVAHRVESTFQTVTVAWLQTGRSRLVVQVHGFADGRDPWDVVVSAGTEGPRASFVEGVGMALARWAPDARIALFPPDGKRLAALDNAQGRAAAKLGARFLHLELGASLRRRLREELELAAFARNLVEVLNVECR